MNKRCAQFKIVPPLLGADQDVAVCRRTEGHEGLHEGPGQYYGLSYTWEDDGPNLVSTVEALSKFLDTMVEVMGTLAESVNAAMEPFGQFVEQFKDLQREFDEPYYLKMTNPRKRS